jgi:uncharacterized protein
MVRRRIRGTIGRAYQHDKENGEMIIDREELVTLTEQYGGAWGIQHTRRLLHLIDLIGADQTYNADVVWVAAHLHDWGGYKEWKQDGVDHAVRSKQVAADFMQARAYPADFAARVLECIEFHHSPDPGRSTEAILLCDADVLDFLGVTGVLRDFSKNAKNMRKAYEVTQKRRAKLPGGLVLAASRDIAAARLQRMDDLYAAFEEETGGCF